MKIKISKVIPLLLISILSCGESKGQFDFSKPIVISEKILVSVNASTFFDTVEYIQLQNNPLIGRIGKVVIFKDKVYILDLTQKSILCFDIRGNFISQYLKIGRGPLEYREINDFDILESHNKIIVLTDKNTLYEFDLGLDNQKLLFKTQFNTTNFAILDRDKYIFYTPFGIYNETAKEWSFHELVTYSPSRKQYTSLIANSNAVRFGYSTPYTIFKSRYILMVPLMQYAIYFISEPISHSSISIDFGALGHPKEKLSKLKSYNDWVDLTNPEGSGNGKVKLITSPYIVKNILYFKSIINGFPNSTFYDVNKGGSIITRSIINDFQDKMPFGSIKGVTNDGFIAIIEPLEIIRSQKDFSTTNKYTLNVKESDNPIIGIYYVKR